MGVTTSRYPRRALVALGLVGALSLSACSLSLPLPSEGQGGTGAKVPLPKAGPLDPSKVGTSKPATPGTVPAPKDDEPKGMTKMPDRQDVDLSFKQIDGIVDPPAGSGMERYTKQKLQWSSCSYGECADMLVPMDYARPDYKAITIKLSRAKSTSTPRLGSLLSNPGGPGGPGLDLAKSSRFKGLEQYDKIGFDTRGAGESTPVVCYDNMTTSPQPKLDEMTSMDSSPDTEEEYEAAITMQRDFAKGCAERSGEYLKYIGTEQTVQDMDMIRQLVGDPKLNWVGWSYGTYLGSYYAYKFPDKVGRMVLDSAVNLTNDNSLSQAMGFDRALRNFAEYSVKKGSKLGGSADEIIGNIGKFLDKLDSAPIKGSGDRKLTQALAVTGIITALYGTEEEFSYLEMALDRAMNQDNGELLLMFADLMNGRQKDGSYEQMQVSFPAIACTDGYDYGLGFSKGQWAKEMQKSEFFGRYFGPIGCETWVFKPTTIPEKITAPNSATKILVVGSTGDPATPYEQSIWMADQLGNAQVLTLDGPGHGTFGGNNSCVNTAVLDYLKTGKLPAKDKVCK